MLSESDFCAIADLVHLQELVLDCEQPPEMENGAEEIKWGLQDFPEGMLHLTNMTHLTLTCHYGITELPETISKLSKLEVRIDSPLSNTYIPSESLQAWHSMAVTIRILQLEGVNPGRSFQCIVFGPLNLLPQQASGSPCNLGQGPARLFASSRSQGES